VFFIVETTDIHDMPHSYTTNQEQHIPQQWAELASIDSVNGHRSVPQIDPSSPITMNTPTSPTSPTRRFKKMSTSSRSFPSLASQSSDGASMFDQGSTFTGHDDSTMLIGNLHESHDIASYARSFGNDSLLAPTVVSEAMNPVVETRDPTIDEERSDDVQRSSPVQDTGDLDEDVRLSRRREDKRSKDASPEVKAPAPEHNPPSLSGIPRSRSAGSRVTTRWSRSGMMKPSDSEPLEAVMEAMTPKSRLSPAEQIYSSGIILVDTSAAVDDGIPQRQLKSPSTRTEETDEIVREVRRRLISLAGAKSENPETSDAWDPNPPPSSSLCGSSTWTPVDKEATTPTRTKDKSPLASKSDLSLSDSDEDKCSFWKRWRCCIIVLAMILLLILAIVTASVVRSKNKKEDHSIQNVAASRPPALRATSSPTAAPTLGPPAPTEGPTSEPSLSVLGAAMELIQNRIHLLSGDALWDETTPQHAAYDWLINSDDGGNPIDTVPIDIITERYVMALFFFGMNGEAWPMRFGFLSGVSVCDWNDDASGLGVFCDDSSGNVQEIALSKSTCV
jgi:hypothetical protein